MYRRGRHQATPAQRWVLAYVCLNVFIMICARLFAVAQTLRHADLMFADSPAAAAREAYRAANTTRWLYLLDHQEEQLKSQEEKKDWEGDK